MISETRSLGHRMPTSSETVRATRWSEEAKTLSPGTVREAIEQRGDRAGRNERASE